MAASGETLPVRSDMTEGTNWPFLAVRRAAALAGSAVDETFGAFVVDLCDSCSDRFNSRIIDMDEPGGATGVTHDRWR